MLAQHLDYLSPQSCFLKSSWFSQGPSSHPRLLCLVFSGFHAVFHFWLTGCSMEFMIDVITPCFLLFHEFLATGYCLTSTDCPILYDCSSIIIMPSHDISYYLFKSLYLVHRTVGLYLRFLWDVGFFGILGDFGRQGRWQISLQPSW